MNRGCNKCKFKGKAAVYDEDWNVRSIYCEKKKKFVKFRWECEDYEPNLHDHCTAPQGS